MDIGGKVFVFEIFLFSFLFCQNRGSAKTERISNEVTIKEN